MNAFVDLSEEERCAWDTYAGSMMSSAGAIVLHGRDTDYIIERRVEEIARYADAMLAERRKRWPQP